MAVRLIFFLVTAMLLWPVIAQETETFEQLWQRRGLSQATIGRPDHGRAEQSEAGEPVHGVAKVAKHRKAGRQDICRGKGRRYFRREGDHREMWKCNH
jgi:hypothetical protein